MRHLHETFKALSDINRLRILGLLLEAPCCVGELVNGLGLPQSLVSRHLAHLRHAGLVERRRKGPRVEYRVRRDPDLPPGLWPWLKKALRTRPAFQEDLERWNRFRAAKGRSTAAPV